MMMMTTTDCSSQIPSKIVGNEEDLEPRDEVCMYKKFRSPSNWNPCSTHSIIMLLAFLFIFASGLADDDDDERSL